MPAGGHVWAALAGLTLEQLFAQKSVGGNSTPASSLLLLNATRAMHVVEVESLGGHDLRNVTVAFQLDTTTFFALTAPEARYSLVTDALPQDGPAMAVTSASPSKNKTKQKVL